MRRLQVAAICAALGTLAGGCATITGSEMQSVMVSAKDKSGAVVEKAECKLESPRGSWKVATPGSVMVARSSDDIQVECTKDGQTPGLAKLISRAHGGMFGNIIFGGGIGALIDHNKGTGYEYPNVAVIVMGETTMIDRRDEENAKLNGDGKAPTSAATGTATPATASASDCKPAEGGGPARC